MLYFTKKSFHSKFPREILASSVSSDGWGSGLSPLNWTAGAELGYMKILHLVFEGSLSAKVSSVPENKLKPRDKWHSLGLSLRGTKPQRGVSKKHPWRD